MRRVDVEVLAKYQLDDKIIPVSVKWDDGRTFEIDQVLDIRPAASTKVGGTGIRYLVRIGRTRTYRFLEENNWFVEAKGVQ
ncbi:hypothetical protein ACS3UN_12295 [Oscillospiraceae bacterium LTW-04]|nr:hypothetical protein RBH76_14040 [Oscillospiraceae bacterium MB24-C1]WMJ83866.1 hypothetical protein RBH76_00095 [Oscillospiraceae bacterium MB24-C1]